MCILISEQESQHLLWVQTPLFHRNNSRVLGCVFQAHSRKEDFQDADNLQHLRNHITPGQGKMDNRERWALSGGTWSKLENSCHLEAAVLVRLFGTLFNYLTSRGRNPGHSSEKPVMISQLRFVFVVPLSISIHKLAIDICLKHRTSVSRKRITS